MRLIGLVFWVALAFVGLPGAPHDFSALGVLDWFVHIGALIMVGATGYELNDDATLGRRVKNLNQQRRYQNEEGGYDR